MSARAASHTLTRISSVIVTLAAGLALIGGCAGSKQPPLPPLQPPPNVGATITHRAGSPTELPSTQPAAVAVTAQDALDVSVEWIALTTIPGNLPPVGSQARLIAAPRSADPLLAAGQLSRGARIVPANKLDAFLASIRGGKHGESVAIANNTGALPAGVTASFNLADAAERRIGVDVYRAATTQPSAAAVQLSLTIDDAATKRERLLLDPMSTPMRLGLVVPSQFPSDRVKAVVVVINIADPSDSPEHVDAVARCQNELKQVAAAAAPTQSPGDWSTLSAALASLTAASQAQPSQPARTRAALVYLAAETNSELLGDVALVATPQTLADLHQRISTRIGDPPKRMERDQLGWQLDAATLESLNALQSAEKLPPELAGVLARYAGEAARNAGSLDELLKLASREQFQARLIAENFTYLEDASPSSRVRAYDWLAAHNRAPAKYDPLAPSRERAAAIDAAMTAAATQPAAGGAQ